MSEQGVAPKLALTASQRSAIYQEVHTDRAKVAPSRFAAQVGAEVRPDNRLYHACPDDILANNPETKLYKFTKVDDAIVLVDPTGIASDRGHRSANERIASRGRRLCARRYSVDLLVPARTALGSTSR